MGALEIIIIIIGIIIIVGSFFLPEGNKGVEISIPDEIIRNIIEKETKKAIFQIEEHTDETVSSIKEKTERSMEKLSNEKIMAIDEFSNTILDKIYKNHEEAVFLYDMLSNKHVQLKNTMGELEKSIKLYKQEISYKSEEIIMGHNIQETTEKQVETKQSGTTNVLLNEISTGIVSSGNQEDYQADELDGLKVEEYLENGEEKELDQKELILKYHKEGKKDVEIAQILGMGVGEVKLIIGLFDGN